MKEGLNDSNATSKVEKESVRTEPLERVNSYVCKYVGMWVLHACKGGKSHKTVCTYRDYYLLREFEEDCRSHLDHRSAA